jgi:hypothetical protein
MRKTRILILIVLISSLFAGIYGIIHDQITYLISPEYFTKFKFVQFGFVEYENIIIKQNVRLIVAIVGFLSTWWVGFIIGIVLGIIGFIHNESKQMFKITFKAILITMFVAFLTGIIGLIFGKFYLAEIGVNWWMPKNLLDKKNFIAVGSTHNFGYLGGLIGLLFGSFYSYKKSFLNI